MTAVPYTWRRVNDQKKTHVCVCGRHDFSVDARRESYLPDEIVFNHLGCSVARTQQFRCTRNDNRSCDGLFQWTLFFQEDSGRARACDPRVCVDTVERSSR